MIKVILISLGVFIIIILIGLRIPNYPKQKSITSPLVNPLQISGWIAWWEEEKAYDLIKKYPNNISSISPVWFMIDKNFEIIEMGKLNKEDIIQNVKKYNIKIIPTLGSELTGKELGIFFKNKKKRDDAVDRLIELLGKYAVNGIDIDLEGLDKKSKDNYLEFITSLSKIVKQKNMILTVAIPARSEKIVWEGSEGYDLDKIGKIVDQVRVMTYDQHSPSSNPGPVASLDWIKEIALYNSSKIPHEKLIFGIPTYGYIWDEESSKGYQYYEFNTIIKSFNVTQSRDPKSYELHYNFEDGQAYLSDAIAMQKKIATFRSLGFNKFIFWHLGGLDEKIFQ